MALNKYMHPRNIYKNPPNFAKLANTYTEFSNIVKVDVTGKVSVDFKDPQSLRILTKYLLKSDFNLDVVIPQDRLVPTLPLRLNYILWIEDLLNSIQRENDVWGIDIGTGACAIYPLLASVKNKWHMIGTDTDEQSLQKANENVLRNNLEELIQLIKNSDTSVIEHLFTNETEQKFDFCMCNPPFYSSIQELCESRSPARPEPKNGFTGSPQELITEGGELEFCRKLIKESKHLKDKVIFFTTMVGHKYSLKELLHDLKIEDIKHTHTEFCQGRVTRWGLAWTFQDYDIYELVPPRDKPRKKNVPITYLLPPLPNSSYDMDSITKKIKDILNELKIKYQILNKRRNNMALDVIATTNTWSNQRRKRRLMKRIEENQAKKLKLNEEQNTDIKRSVADNTAENSKKININDTCFNNLMVHDDLNLRNACNEESTSTSETVIVHALLKVLKKDDNFLLEMEFWDGSGGKEGIHQIIQYIKNKWK